MPIIEVGKVTDFSPQGGGWLVGFGANFKDPTLRQMAKSALAHTVGLKWMAHKRGDPDGQGKPESDGCTLSMLVGEKGDFRVEFSEREDFASLLQTTQLRDHGDFVIWGGGLHHRWYADADSTILTMRWVPIEPRDHGAG